jgi:hypothetical protein
MNLKPLALTAYCLPPTAYFFLSAASMAAFRPS